MPTKFLFFYVYMYMFEMKAQRMRTWVDSSFSEYEFTTQYKHVKLMETFQSKQVNQEILQKQKTNSLGYD